jgi:hypothetical protein
LVNSGDPKKTVGPSLTFAFGCGYFLKRSANEGFVEN